MRDDQLARRMFFIGCLGLPFLWFVNVLHFRSEIPFLDSDEYEISDDNAAAATSDLPILGSDDDGMFVTQELISLFYSMNNLNFLLQ